MAPVIRDILQGRYIEPFLGSGAIFFAVAPDRATLADLNAELIEVYKQVAAHPERLEEELKQLPVNKKTYYKIRCAGLSDPFERALRFIYLNRTCYGGLHRTNQKGKFNVPYGGGSRTPEVVYRDRLIKGCSALLNNPCIEVLSGDFGPIMAASGNGDVVFCDPTYRAAGRGRFDRYGPQVFSWKDQERLAACAASAKGRGATVLVMNADVPEVEALYRSAIVIRVEKSKAIGNEAKSATRHRELLLIFDPLGREALWAGLEARLELAELTAESESIRGAA